MELQALHGTLGGIITGGEIKPSHKRELTRASEGLGIYRKERVEMEAKVNERKGEKEDSKSLKGISNSGGPPQAERIRNEPASLSRLLTAWRHRLFFFFLW